MNGLAQAKIIKGLLYCFSKYPKQCTTKQTQLKHKIKIKAILKIIKADKAKQKRWVFKCQQKSFTEVAAFPSSSCWFQRPQTEDPTLVTIAAIRWQWYLKVFF